MLVLKGRQVVDVAINDNVEVIGLIVASHVVCRKGLRHCSERRGMYTTEREEDKRKQEEQEERRLL